MRIMFSTTAFGLSRKMAAWCSIVTFQDAKRKQSYLLLFWTAQAGVSWMFLSSHTVGFDKYEADRSTSFPFNNYTRDSFASTEHIVSRWLVCWVEIVEEGRKRKCRVTDTLTLLSRALTFTILVHCTRPPVRAAQANYKTGLLSFLWSESYVGTNDKELALKLRKTTVDKQPVRRGSW